MRAFQLYRFRNFANRQKMHAINSIFGPLTFSLAVLAQATTSGILELDLVFPRSDTYAPSALFPFVWAIQNPRLTLPLDLNIEYTIYSISTNYRLRNFGYSLSQGRQLFQQRPFLCVPEHPQVQYHRGHLEAALGPSRLAIAPEPSTTWDTPPVRNSPTTAKPFSSPPSGAPSCRILSLPRPIEPAPTQIITTRSMLPAPSYISPYEYDGRSSCAILPPSPPPAGNPCGAKVDPAAASSISAALTATACRFPSPVVSCPPEE